MRMFKLVTRGARGSSISWPSSHPPTCKLKVPVIGDATIRLPIDARPNSKKLELSGTMEKYEGLRGMMGLPIWLK